MCIKNVIIALQDNRVAARKFYQHVSCCVSIQQMAQLILIIWKFLRNRILKQLQQNRVDNEMAEAVQPPRANSRRTNAVGAKRSRRAQPEEVPTPGDDDENKENHGTIFFLKNSS